jgi:hypothetical protein
MIDSDPITPQSTYFSRYNDEAADPCNGDYTAVMAIFHASVGREPVARSVQIYEQVYTTAEVQPHLYLMMTQGMSGSPVMTVLHRPNRHVAPMGSTVAKLDVTFMGDMRGLLPPTLVFFLHDAFKHTGTHRVPNPETLDQAFAGDPNLQAVGPYDEDDAGSDTIVSRPMVFLPPSLGAIALKFPA